MFIFLFNFFFLFILILSFFQIVFYFVTFFLIFSFCLKLFFLLLFIVLIFLYVKSITHTCIHSTDGSGQQYISIPLTTNQPTTAQTLKSPKEPNTKAQRCKGNIETARDMRMKDMKSAQSPSKASTSNSNSSAAALAGLPIKQELE